MRYTARIKRDEDGSYWARVDELPGCFASGFTVDELVEGLGDAIRVHISQESAPTEGNAAEHASVEIDEIKVLV